MGKNQKKNNTGKKQNKPNQSSRNQSKNGTELHRLPLFPMILAIGYLPLLMRLHSYDSMLGTYEWFPSEGGSTDVFLWLKMVFIIPLAVFCIVALIWRKFFDGEKLYFFKGMWLLVIAGGMIFVSGLFSFERELAFAGSFEMFQSVPVMLSYLVFFAYGCCAVRSAKRLKRVLLFAAPGIAIEVLIAFFQGLGLDFFMTDFGKKLYMPQEYWDNLDAAQLAFGKGTAYGTLYNPDYVSMYMGVMVPLFAGLFFAAKKIWVKVLSLAFIAAGLFILSKSAISGYMGIGVAAVIGLLIFLFIRGKKPFLIGVLGVGAASVLLLVLTLIPGAVHNKVWEALSLTDPVESEIRVYHIDTADDGVHFTLTDGTEYTAVFDDTTEYREDAVGDHVFVLSPYMIEDAGVRPMTISVNGYGWDFLNMDGTYWYLNKAGRAVRMSSTDDTPRVFPMSMFVLRGLIWDETFPLLTDHILLGCGANTFVTEFPQTNYVLENYYDRLASLDVKPHSMYLQQWVENGLIAMIALVSFLILCVVRALMTGLSKKAAPEEKETTPKKKNAPVSDWEENRRFMRIMLLAGALSICSWLIVVLANDLENCTGPLFFSVVGITAGLTGGMIELNKENSMQ